MSAGLYPIRRLENGDYEVRMTSDRWWPLPADSVMLFSRDVPPAPGCWVLVRGRLGAPEMRTWPQRKDRWLATATEVLSAPADQEVQKAKDIRLRAWGLRRA